MEVHDPDVRPARVKFREAGGDGKIIYGNQLTLDIGHFYFAGDAAGGPVMGKAFRGALVQAIVTQSMTDNTFLGVNYGKVIYDTDNFWSSGDPERLTVPGGVRLVRVQAGIEMTSLAIANQHDYQIQMNGSSTEPGGMPWVQYHGVATAGMSITSAVVPVKNGDYFTAVFRQQHGSAKDTRVAGNGVWMSIEVCG